MYTESNMDEEKDILKDVLRNRLADHRMPVDDDLWAKIATSLPPAKPATTVRRLGLPIAAAAAMILLLLGMGWLFITPGEDKEMAIAQAKQSAFRKTLAPETLTHPETEPLVRLPLVRLPQHPPTGSTRKTAVSEKAAEEEILSDDSTDSTIRQDDKPQQTHDKLQQPAGTGETVLVANYPPNPKKVKTQNLSFALAMGNTIGSSPEMNAADNHSPFFFRSTFDNEYSGNNPGISDIKHKTPITVGLSVRKHVSNKWALESGLTYTRLSSTKTLTFANHFTISEDINLDYVGIPLKVIYSLYENDRLSLYATTGGMVEPCVNRERISPATGTKNNINISELQWGVLGNVGINYHLIGNIGLFVESGVNYYFDDGSDVMTIRKDKPCNWNLQTGIRWVWSNSRLVR